MFTILEKGYPSGGNSCLFCSNVKKIASLNQNFEALLHIFWRTQHLTSFSFCKAPFYPFKKKAAGEWTNKINKKSYTKKFIINRRHTSKKI
jgi:hypothetical protein